MEGTATARYGVPSVVGGGCSGLPHDARQFGVVLAETIKIAALAVLAHLFSVRVAFGHRSLGESEALACSHSLRSRERKKSGPKKPLTAFAVSVLTHRDPSASATTRYDVPSVVGGGCSGGLSDDAGQLGIALL